MRYENICEGVFISRPNRFVADVMINGELHTVHVKNTGRCRELLVRNARVFLEKSDSKSRKTAYDLVAVEKNGRLINMDSHAPNKAVEELFQEGGIFKDIKLLKREVVFNSSRFDFYGIHGDRKFFAEVKGVTLEEDNVVRFPDAPTLRGIKHIRELENAVKQGYEGYVIFVVQMKDVAYFEPNDRTHREFGDALRAAVKNGVRVLCFDCEVTCDGMVLKDRVDVRLDLGKSL